MSKVCVYIKAFDYFEEFSKDVVNIFFYYLIASYINAYT